MKKETEYLLKYIHNDTYKMLLDKQKYRLEEIGNHRRDMELNIRYLLNFGVKHIDYVVLERLDDLLLSHHDFIKKMQEYETNFSRDEVMNLLENS